MFNGKNGFNSQHKVNLMNATNLSREMRPALWSVKTTTWGSLFHRDSSNPLNKVLPLCRAAFLGVAVLPFRSCAVKNYLTATRLNCNTAAHDVVTATPQHSSTAELA
jgi:hypothetical protein